MTTEDPVRSGRTQSEQTLTRLVPALIVAMVGGALFQALGLPAPWLTGSAAAVAIAAVGGLRISVPEWLRHASTIFLGTIMGSAVTPDTFAQLPSWPISLVGLLIVVVSMMFAVSLYLERVHGFDPVTARLACVPGNMTYVIALTGERADTADARQVVIVQIVRLAALLMGLPFILDFLGFVATGNGWGGQGSAFDAAALAILFVSGLVGGMIFHWLRFPAGSMCGAMFASAVLSGGGVVATSIPDHLLVPGFAVIGAVVGANFAGTERALLVRTMAAALGAVVVGVTVALIVAWPVALAMDVSVAQIWLAYSPGGADTMSVLALALGLEPTFVVSHHVIRMFGLGVVVPLWLRLYVPVGEKN